MIYKILLVNPLLSSWRSVPTSSSVIQPVAYELDLKVLCMSKAIYIEAIEVLYGDNTFFMCPLSNDWSFSENLTACFCLSPLTRHVFHSISHNVSLLGSQSALSKVRRWNVVLYIPYIGSGWLLGPHQSLTAFSRAISRSNPDSLEVVVVQKGALQRRLGSSGEYQSISDVLKPLSLLRGVGNLTIRDADSSEVPDALHKVNQTGQAFRLASHLEGEEALRATLINSIQDKASIDLLSEMYSRLLAYAQSFESCRTFKEAMAEAAENDGFEEGTTDEGKPFNPFRGETMHPVEKALIQAQIAVDSYNGAAFKEQRSIVLEYLEPQYRRVCIAAENMVHFIKEEKHYYGLFDLNCSTGLIVEAEIKKCHIAMILL
jgi:hypothetical protein